MRAPFASVERMEKHGMVRRVLVLKENEHNYRGWQPNVRCQRDETLYAMRAFRAISCVYPKFHAR